MRSEHRLNGDEFDAFTRWRKYVTALSRPGIVKKTKKRAHKKDRKVGKQKIEDQLRDMD